MISYVPHDAACDERLTPVAFQLLIYLGGHDVHSRTWSGKWCWESVEEIAEALSTETHTYTAPLIRQARALLWTCGYLEERVGVFFHACPTEDGSVVMQEQQRLCYRVVVTIDDPYAATQHAIHQTTIPHIALN